MKIICIYNYYSFLLILSCYINSINCVISINDARNTMKAVVASAVASKEGDFSKISVKNISIPTPSSGEVLIKVAASSVNPVDWKILTGGLPLKFPHTLGFDVSGTVAQCNDCKRLKENDVVWADLGKTWLLRGGELGAYAEYALADEEQVGLKPNGIDIYSAGTLPLVSLTSYQALKMTGIFSSGGNNNLTVVVTSGAGGTGFTGIQLAKAAGATRVITAASPTNDQWLTSIGATDVVDYHQTTIWEYLKDQDVKVDIVYDNYGAPGTADLAMPYFRSGGVFIYLPGKGGGKAKRPRKDVKEINYGLCDSSKHDDLDILAKYVENGKLKAKVDTWFTLDNIKLAFNASIAGHVAGKIGIRIGL